jgi:uncharacterized protein
LQTGGEITTNVDRVTAFGFVGDPMRLAKCIPGCEDLKEIAPRKYSAVLANKVGFISVKFDVTVEITKIEPPEAIDASISGNATGLGGRLTANATVRLEDLPSGGTLIKYTVEMGLTGKLGGIGQPVFRAKSDELGKKFAVNLKAAMEGGSAT